MRVAIVGCGVIGRSWMRVFTRAGHEVCAWDHDTAAVQRAMTWHDEERVRAGSPGPLPTTAESLGEALRGVDWVQESGPESLDAKQAIYLALDKLVPHEAILASSTSTLDMTLIAEGLAGAARCIVAHPVNPPHVVPAVEVLGGVATSPAVVERTCEVLRAVGQVPVLMHRYVRGFLLNRMQAALVREAVHLVQSGVADVDAVDAVIRDGLGLRWALMGPFGVANTNADGGSREYFTRYAGSFSWLMDDLGPTPEFSPGLIERIGAEVDAMYAGHPREGVRAWRDRMVERITALKREDHL